MDNYIIGAKKKLILALNDALEPLKRGTITSDIAETEYEPVTVLQDLGALFLRNIGDKDVEIVFDIDKTLPKRLQGDIEKIQKIIVSLVDSAMKLTDHGYIKLLIKIYPVVENELIELYISVKDTGREVGREDMAALFDSVNRNTGDSGSGKKPKWYKLPDSRYMMEVMGGEIYGKSEAGTGSEFWFSVQQKVINSEKVAEHVKLLDSGAAPRISTKFSNTYREDAFLTMINTYKLSYIPYDILLDVGVMVDYLFTDGTTYETLEQEMAGCVRKLSDIIVLRNPEKKFDSISGVTEVSRPFFTQNFCRLLNQEESIW